jgi:hypothetical protein
MRNYINRTLFKTANIAMGELLRRLDIFSAQVHDSVEGAKSDITTLQSAATSDAYTGTVYATDEDNNTVALFVQSGKVKTISKVRS